MGDSIAVDLAKKKGQGDGVVTLSTGVRARLVAVSSALLTEAQARIKTPPVPMWFNEDKQREEPNPNDPAYLSALAEVPSMRAMAVMDTLIMFGVELVDPVPEDGKWVRRLELLQRRGHVDFGDLDFDDPIDREFLYKRYIAVAQDDYVLLSRKCGLLPGEVDRQVESFPSN